MRSVLYYNLVHFLLSLVFNSAWRVQIDAYPPLQSVREVIFLVSWVCFKTIPGDELTFFPVHKYACVTVLWRLVRYTQWSFRIVIRVGIYPLQVLYTKCWIKKGVMQWRVSGWKVADRWWKWLEHRCKVFAWEICVWMIALFCTIPAALFGIPALTC